MLYILNYGSIKPLEYNFEFNLSTERNEYEMKLLVKILITLFGAILIFTNLKESNMWLISFWIVLTLYMIFEGVFISNKNS